MAREEKGCVQIPARLNRGWIVILFLENTGLHEQFWCWKVMGSILDRVGLKAPMRNPGVDVKGVASSSSLD